MRSTAIVNPASLPSGNGIKFVLGILKRGGKKVSEVQSVIFDKLSWTTDAAKHWLKDHGFKVPSPDAKAEHLRFRQKSPTRYKEFSTIEAGHHTAKNPTLKYFPLNMWPDKSVIKTESPATRTRLLESRKEAIKWASDEVDAHGGIGHLYQDTTKLAVITADKGKSNPSKKGRLKPGDKILGGYEVGERGLVVRHLVPPHIPGKDYGSDPIWEGGKFVGYRMVPSGDIVDGEERERRLGKQNPQYTITGQHGSMVRIHEQDSNRFLSTFWVNHGETITSQRATHSTLAGAKRWADKVIKQHEGRGGYAKSNPLGTYHGTVVQLKLVQARGDRDGYMQDWHKAAYPPSSTRESMAFKKALREMAGELGEMTCQDRENYKQVYYQGYRQGAYRGHQEDVKGHIQSRENPSHGKMFPSLDDSPASNHQRMIHSLTQYDREQSTKKGYNMYALPQYMRAADEAKELMEKGSTPVQAINEVFEGRVAARLHRDLATGGQVEWKGTLPNPRNPESVSSSLAHHTALTTDPGFQSAPPEVQAGIMTGMDLAESLIPKVEGKSEDDKDLDEVAGDILDELRESRKVVEVEENSHTTSKSVHVRVYSTQEKAEINRDKLRTLGIPAHVERAKRGDGYVWYLMVDQRRYPEALEMFDGWDVVGRGGRMNPRSSGEADRDAARELELYIENDADLYRGQTTSINKNLALKKAKGTYKHDLAVKLWMYLMESGARKYNKEFGGGGSRWQDVFTVPTRKLAAESFAQTFETEYDLGNYDRLLPAKYQKKGNPDHITGDLGQAAFDAAKDYRISGAYYESGVANARVARYGFIRWYNDLAPAATEGYRKSTLERNWMEGWAAGKRVERKGNVEKSAYIAAWRAHGVWVRQQFASEEDAQRMVDHLIRQGKTAKLERHVTGSEQNPEEYTRLPGDKSLGSSREPLFWEDQTGGYKGEAYRDITGTWWFHMGGKLRWKIAGKVIAKRLKNDLSMGHLYPRGKQNPEEAAAALSEEFHGRPAETVTTVTEEIHEHEYLTELGQAINLKVRTLSGYDAMIEFPKSGSGLVHLACSENGKQLYLVGGDQALDLAALHMDGDKWLRDKVKVGQLKEVSYQTQKGFDGFKVIEYFHHLGEVTKVKPDLIYDALNRTLEIVGGQYSTTSRGIEN